MVLMLKVSSCLLVSNVCSLATIEKLLPWDRIRISRSRSVGNSTLTAYFTPRVASPRGVHIGASRSHPTQFINFSCDACGKAGESFTHD